MSPRNPRATTTSRRAGIWPSISATRRSCSIASPTAQSSRSPGSATSSASPICAGESVVDLGSGSGLDLFFAANQVGSTGRVIGVDFTVEQLDKARQLATDGAYDQVELREGRIEDLPVDDASSDCVISNGVVNLSPEKDRVFAEAARVLRPGGRLAIADIVTEQQLKEAITCDANLWAACIGGAAQEDAYRAALEGAGLQVTEVVANPYRFISDQALGASEKYGVKSASILAVKE